MKMRTWFGHIDDEFGASRLPGGAAEIVEGLMGVLEEEASSGWEGSAGRPAVQPDIRKAALEAGLFPDDAEYNAALREVAMELVRRRLRASTGAEAELLQTIEALDDLNEVINRLEERLY